MEPPSIEAPYERDWRPPMRMTALQDRYLSDEMRDVPRPGQVHERQIFCLVIYPVRVRRFCQPGIERRRVALQEEGSTCLRG